MPAAQPLAGAGRVPLWRDARVLQWVFQLLVLAAVAAVVIWLFNNYVSNADRQNIPTSFDFLDNPTSFDCRHALGYLLGRAGRARLA